MKSTSQDLQQEIVSSSAKLFYILITIVILYVYAGLNKIDRNEAISNLQALSIIHALIMLSEESTKYREMPIRSLLKFHKRAEDEAEKNGFVIPEKFRYGMIQGATLHQIPMRFAPAGRCEVAVVEGENGAIFYAFTNYVAGGLYRIRSEDSKVVSFGNCIGGYGPDFHALIFKDEKGETVVGLPQSFQNSFPGLHPPIPFEFFVFKETEEIKSKLPLIVREYLDLNGPFVIFHLQALRHLILKYATDRRDVFYSADEFDIAVSTLFEEVEARAGFIGINTTITSIIRFGPIVLLVLAWELWRRIRRIDATIRHNTTWFPFDVQYPLAAAVASIFALAPLISGLLVTYFFIQSQDLQVVAFGRLVTLSDMFTFNLPLAPGPGWISFDYWAFIMIPMFFALIALLSLTSMRLLAIIRVSTRSTQS